MEKLFKLISWVVVFVVLLTTQVLYSTWVELKVYNWLILGITNYPIRFVELLSFSLFWSLLRFKPTKYEDDDLEEEIKIKKTLHYLKQVYLVPTMGLLIAYIIKQFI